MAALFSGITF